ncbi:hypothetical protein FKM82_025691 [Ascaphus truei]
MTSLYHLCVIVLYISRCAADVVLSQKDSEIGQVGKSIKLQCVVSGYNIDDHHMHWVRQAPGGGLVWLAAFRTGYATYVGENFKGIVTPSTSGSTALLNIDRLMESDSATYFCAREHTQMALPILMTF